TCLPPNTPGTCAMPKPPNCRVAEICNNGEDDDCTGKVAAGCQCVAGDVMPCFPWAPGQRNVGACKDGIMTCVQITEVETGWGPCKGAIVREPESCGGPHKRCTR